MERLTFTDAELDEIRQYAPDFDCPIKAEEGSITSRFCDRVCDEFQNTCPFKAMGKKLKEYEDAEEQGLLLRLPVAIGDKVYEIIEETVPNNYFYISEREVQDVSAKAVKYADDWCEYGYPNLYLTREEAEQALKQMGE